MTRLIFVVCLLGSCLGPGLAGPANCARGSAECQGQDYLLMLQARVETQTQALEDEEEDQKEPDEGSVALEESDEVEEAEREDEDEGEIEEANETTFGDAKRSCSAWDLEQVYACSERKGSCSKIRRNLKCGWCEPNWFWLCKQKALLQCATNWQGVTNWACYHAACAGYDHCQEKMCCSALGPPWDECHKQCMAVKGRQETYQIGKVYSKSCLKRKKAAQKSGCLRSLAETFAGRDAANESNEEAATGRETEDSLDESLSGKRTCG